MPENIKLIIYKSRWGEFWFVINVIYRQGSKTEPPAGPERPK